MIKSLFAFFEVLDKEPSILSIWLIFIFIGLIGFFLTYKEWRFIFLVILTPILPIIFLLSEFHDEFIYPAIKSENPSYLPQTYIAMALSFLLPIIGAVFNIKKKTKND